MTTPTLDLSIELLKRPSVTPKDENCQNIIADRLANSGFVSEFMYFGEGDTERNAQVKNLWARRGNASPLVCFLGHTDVVPTGDEKIGRIRHLNQPSKTAICTLVVRPT